MRRPALLLAVMAFLAYTYTIPRGPLANSDSHIALTRAIVDDHSFTIDRYAAALADRSSYRGHYYTDKAPGLSLLAVPMYAALRLVLPPAFFGPDLFFMVRYLLTALVLGVPAALFVGLLWRFLAPIAGRRRASWLALGYGLGTMAWGLSALLFSHMLAATLLFGAFMLLYRHGPQPHPSARGQALPSPTSGRGGECWRWAVAGGLCGLAVLCEYPAALVAALIALFAVQMARGAGRRGVVLRAVLFAAAGLIALAPLGLYNLAVYGSVISQGYAHLHGQAQFVTGMGHGIEGVGWPSLTALWGITFSPYRGIFMLSPFLALVLPGLLLMWRRAAERPAALLCAATIVVMLLFTSGYYFWDGGVSLGPRHVAPALPFLLFPCAFALRRRRWRRLAPALILLSIAIVGLCCTTVLICLPGILNPILDLALPIALRGPIPNTWGLLLGLHGHASLLPLLLGEILLALALRRSLRPVRARRAADPAACLQRDAA